MTTEKQIILTGDRPTGSLHLGHYIGSLKQRILLQREYKQFVLVADMQALTDNGLNPNKVSDNILNVMADYLAVGIDPKLSNICLQSQIPALAELTMLYSNLVSIARLERNPTIKAERELREFNNSIPVGFLAYPVSQAADISAFKSEAVPAGLDQEPMIEQTNDIVRKMNAVIGKDVLKKCRLIESPNGRLSAPNGQGKMSKSSGHAIYLHSTEKEIKKGVNAMYTDPNHVEIHMPGNTEGNVVFEYLDAFHPEESIVSEMKSHYQKGGLGDGKTKQVLNEVLQELIGPIRERREMFLQDKSYLMSVLEQGTEQANEITQSTLDEVKRGLGLVVF